MLIKTDPSRDVRILVIYHPCSIFLNDFGHLLEQYITDSSFLLVAGDAVLFKRTFAVLYFTLLIICSFKCNFLTFLFVNRAFGPLGKAAL